MCLSEKKTSPTEEPTEKLSCYINEIFQPTTVWPRDVPDPFTTLHKVEIDAFHQHVEDALENNCIYVYGQPVYNGYFWEMAR